MAAKRRRAVHMSVGPAEPQGLKPEEDASKFPYEDLSDLMKEAVEEALREAWRRLPIEARRQRVDLMECNEEPITRLLRDELDKLRRDEAEPVPGFNEFAFQHIPESEGVPDCRGMPLNEGTKKPDMVFRPVKIPREVVRSSTYGLFVECKIIHRSTDHHGVKDYCQDGLRKFVSGEYAWAMPSGMMVAYVRNGKDVPSCLTPHLCEEAHKHIYKVKSLPIPCQGQLSRKPPVYISMHERSYHAGSGWRPPGDIKIAHLWLDVM